MRLVALKSGKAARLLTLLAAVTFSITAIADTVVEVTPEDTQGWFERVSNTGTVGQGPADNNGGASSLALLTDGSAGQIIKASRIPLITIGDITSISWDAWSDSATYFPIAQLEYYSQARFGTLFYASSNGGIPASTWTTFTVTAQTMFTDSNTQTTKTFGEWQIELGDILMNYFQVGYGSTGGAFPATTAYTDYIELNGTVWDFEAVATLPPQPTLPSRPVPTLSQWSMILLALLMVGGVAMRRRQKA